MRDLKGKARCVAHWNWVNYQSGWS